MAKYNDDGMSDAALEWLKTNMTKVHICDSQPTTYSQANSTYSLGSASHTITGSPADNGSTGRQIQIPAKSSIAISSSGKMQHVACTGKVSSVNTLLYVTTIPSSSQSSVNASDKVNMAAWNAQVNDVS